MKLQEARQLIKTTFESSFDKSRFTLFINNLLKDAYEEKTFLQTGGQLPQAFADLIRKMERIGKYEDDEGNIIDILVVELKKGRSIEWARTTQRNFIRRYLNGSRGGELKDAALVAFYSEGSEDWRFSLIKMQYSLEKKADELTPAKRFSFLVGKDERSHTAQNQLANLLTLDSAPTLVEIESSFNIETVTKEFFEKYRELFLNLNDHIEKEIKKTKPLREELESQNIDSASFTKKLLGQIVFLYFLQKKGWLGVPKNEPWNKGDKQFLRTLLDQAVAEKKNFFSDYLVYLFYEALATEHRGGSDPSYYSRLNCRIPFLNGGLFEADYDWKKIAISIPNKLFTNTDKTEEGDIGSGVLDVFDRYNFTVKEDEPLEKQVAVDPEMLGKVFENLLEIKDRKSKGAFYTPREIVHYMCQESLIAYLDTSVNSEASTFQKIGTDQTDMFGNKARKGQLPLEAEHGSKIKVERKDIEKFIREGISAIDNDTRVESKGEETASYSYLIPQSIRNYAKELDDALTNIRICDPAIGSGAFPVGMMNEIVKAREILSVYLKDGKAKHSGNTPYEFKRHAIQECIYGVDIDHSAIDIAKLRLWLSLVVDEDDFYKIKPLPNLDYKIVCGNSLVGMVENSFRDVKLEDEIRELEDQLFDETNRERKNKLRDKIKHKIRLLLDSAEQFSGYKIDFDFKIFFSKVFREKKGFDVVIGNPPYVNIVNLPEDVRKYFQKHYVITKNKVDLYAFFVECSDKILRSNASLTFIIPQTWKATDSFSKFREFIFTRFQLRKIVNLEIGTFEAVVRPLIISLRKSPPSPNFKIEILNESFESVGRVSYAEVIQSGNYSLDTESSEEFKRLFKIIEADSTRLENVLQFTRGIKTSDDKRFIHDIAKNDDYHKVYRGKNIKAYSMIWAGEYIWYRPDLMRQKVGSLPHTKELFEVPEKLVTQRVNSSMQLLVAYDNGKNFFLDTTNVSKYETLNPKYSIKYVLALLNSKTINFWYCNKYRMPTIGLYELHSIPIKEISKPEQEPFINLVDYILFVKSRKESDTISQFVPNSFISNFLEKILDGCVYELYFKQHMQEQKINVLKYVNDYITPFASNDTVSKKAEIVLKAFNKLNQSDNIIRNRLLLFTTRSEDVIMTIEKSISR